jgi:hypothetical protein
MKDQFPTLAEFELMPFTHQRKFYEERIASAKFNANTPFWVERLQTAVEECNPIVLMVFPTLGKFYYNLIESEREQRRLSFK